MGRLADFDNTNGRLQIRTMLVDVIIAEVWGFACTILVKT